MVIGYFCIVHERTVRPDFLHGQAGRCFTVWPCGAGTQPLPKGTHHVCGEVTGICPGIGQDFMVFVEALHDIERLSGGKSVLLIRVLLECGQVIERGRI